MTSIADPDRWRWPLALAAATFAALARFGGPAPAAPPAAPAPRVETLVAGDLAVTVRDNGWSPELLSGVAELVNIREPPHHNAFDEAPGMGGGLNLEHIIAGHQETYGRFTPNHGPLRLERTADGRSLRLVRHCEDEPWSVSSTTTFTPVAPHYLDVDFRCRFDDPRQFGPPGFAMFFFASYLDLVDNVRIHFRGVPGAGQPEGWIGAHARERHHRHWRHGGSYRSLDAAPLEYAEDHRFPGNLWSYEWPRFTLPFYYGRAGSGMVFQVMFDRSYTDQDEVRFAVFRWKLPRGRRPAWDFAYVVRRIEAGQTYGFRARVVWKRFVSPDDCQAEYQAWATRPAGAEPASPP